MWFKFFFYLYIEEWLKQRLNVRGGKKCSGGDPINNAVCALEGFETKGAWKFFGFKKTNIDQKNQNKKQQLSFANAVGQQW